MRVLLDECLPRPLANLISGHEVSTVVGMGWGGTRNSRLLALAVQAGFEAFLTVDRNTVSRQQISPILVMVLRAGSNRVEDLEPLIAQAADALEDPNPRVVHIGPLAAPPE
jgi:hypothetical protein